jgi:hypothetical protein
MARIAMVSTVALRVQKVRVISFTPIPFGQE